MRQLLVIELNEISFDYVEHYCRAGKLPNFAGLLREHGVTRTLSETTEDSLEPWIQWVTAHTGLPLDQHGVFRLGDIAAKDLPQIWEVLESHGISVGAISPMNAKHRLKSPAFFVPDPWTDTGITAGPILAKLYKAIAQAVNDNAQAKVTRSAVIGLLVGFLRYANPRHYRDYVELVLRSRSEPWRRAIFLDQLLFDVFVAEVRRSNVSFATLFLNAGAHIQHHYLFNSSAYAGPHRNPSWYAASESDPVFEIYAHYDRMLGEVREAFPGARLMVATGLQQVPHPELTYYWRLKDHAKFLRSIGVAFTACSPRMSRDFLVKCADERAAATAASRLESARASNGAPLFEVDNRGCDLFVMLTYPNEISPGFTFTIEDRTFEGLYEEVAFVALKNGRHDSVGYLIDSATRSADAPSEMPLTALPHLIASCFGVNAPSAHRAVEPSGVGAAMGPLSA